MITKKQAQRLNGYISALEQSAKEIAFAGGKPLHVADADRENHKVIKDRMQKFIREITESSK